MLAYISFKLKNLILGILSTDVAYSNFPELEMEL